MAVMMVLMLVALAVLGPGHHWGSHGSHEPAAQSSQSHKHDVEKEKSDPGDGQP